jgi:hypothetical protein
VVGHAVLKLGQQKDLDPMEKVLPDRSVHDLERNAQAYRRAVW